MNSKLIIAAIACLGLTACQQADNSSKKEEEKKPAAEQTQGGSNEPIAPAQPSSTPAPGTSYYDNNDNQNITQQANPAAQEAAQDVAQDAAQAAAPAEGDAMHVSQQTEPQAAAQ